MYLMDHIYQRKKAFQPVLLLKVTFKTRETIIVSADKVNPSQAAGVYVSKQQTFHEIQVWNDRKYFDHFVFSSVRDRFSFTVCRFGILPTLERRVSLSSVRMEDRSELGAEYWMSEFFGAN